MEPEAKMVELERTAQYPACQPDTIDLESLGAASASGTKNAPAKNAAEVM